MASQSFGNLGGRYRGSRGKEPRTCPAMVNVTELIAEELYVIPAKRQAMQVAQRARRARPSPRSLGAMRPCCSQWALTQGSAIVQSAGMRP